jgi:hypothetical protein
MERWGVVFLQEEAGLPRGRAASSDGRRGPTSRKRRVFLQEGGALPIGRRGATSRKSGFFRRKKEAYLEEEGALPTEEGGHRADVRRRRRREGHGEHRDERRVLPTGRRLLTVTTGVAPVVPGSFTSR